MRYQSIGKSCVNLPHDFPRPALVPSAGLGVVQQLLEGPVDAEPGLNPLPAFPALLRRVVINATVSQSIWATARANAVFFFRCCSWR